MKHKNFDELQKSSTTELTKRIAQLSLETHAISKILESKNRRKSITSTINWSNKSDGIDRENERIDRNGITLQLRDRVKVLTKGKIKVSQGTVIEYGSLLIIESDTGVRIKRKSTNLSRINN